MTHPIPTVAALYVAEAGCYFDIEGVDPWDASRDARQYAGPHPVVAHPPCERWGAYWNGGPGWIARGKPPKRLGDDGGCFSAALAAVRQWGGVLEHPKGSRAWTHFGINRPPAGGGWVVADWEGGWTCCVEQGHYGHRARKPTWLYAARLSPPSLVWGPAPNEPALQAMIDRSRERRGTQKPSALEWMSKQERAATPMPFRDLLLGIARTARLLESAA